MSNLSEATGTDRFQQQPPPHRRRAIFEDEEKMFKLAYAGKEMNVVTSVDSAGFLDRNGTMCPLTPDRNRFLENTALTTKLLFLSALWLLVELQTQRNIWHKQ